MALLMSVEDLHRCERECTRLCHDFAAAVDSRQYGMFADLFAPDGVFDRAGQVSYGQAEILQFLNARPADKVTRHACTNIRIDMTGPQAATGHSYVLVFQGQALGDAQQPLPTTAPMVVEYQDTYVLMAEGWKFKHRVVKIVFQP